MMSHSLVIDARDKRAPVTRSPAVHFSILSADYQDRDVKFVADRVDSVAEDQVLNAAVSVGAHDEQIGMDLAGVADNLPAGVGAVSDGGFNLDLHLAERVDQTVEIFASG